MTAGCLLHYDHRCLRLHLRVCTAATSCAPPPLHAAAYTRTPAA